MRCFPRLSSRPAVLVLGGALLCLALPSDSQQPTPAGAPLVVVPATAVRNARTRVTLDFTPPPGLQLARAPRLRVIDAKDELVELLPSFLSQQTPTALGFRELHTENYLPGIYRVRAEVDYLQASGSEATLVSPWVTLTVPAS
jgi:hypothetical protein